MFTGIVQQLCPVHRIVDEPNIRRLTLVLGKSSATLELGASVAVNGVCLTVSNLDNPNATFDVIRETLNLTNLGVVSEGDLVNVERSYRVGDEIGGHIVSGHVTARVKLLKIISADNVHDLWLQTNPELLKYLHPKGFVALDGASLTIAEVDWEQARIRVSLIPETLARTTLGRAQKADWVNLEIDAQTQAVVATVERTLESPEWQKRFRDLFK